MVGAHHPQPADQHRHLGRGQAQQLGAIEQQFLRRHGVILLEPVAVSIGDRLQRLEGLRVCHCIGGVATARCEGHLDVVARGPGRFLDTQVAGQHDHIGNTGSAGSGDGLQHTQHSRQTLGFVAGPILLRRQADARPIGTAAHVGAPESTRAIPGGGHAVGNAEATGPDLRLHRTDIVVGPPRRHRILPDQILARHLGPEVARPGPHIAVRQLEPGAGKGVLEIRRILAKARHDLAIGGIHFHRHVGVGHHRHAAKRGVFDVDRHVFFSNGHRLPLVRTRRAGAALPLVIEQHVEIAHVEPCRMSGPGALQATGHRVPAHTAAGLVQPAQALILNFGALRLRPEIGGVAIAVALAHGVAAGGQRHRFFIVHGHALESLAHGLRGLQGIRLAIDPFRIHIDQSHLHRGERILE